MEKLKYYNKIRSLALVALLLSTLLVIIYSAVSLTDTKTMNGYVDATKEFLSPILGKETVALERIIEISTDKGSSFIYCGEDISIRVRTFPANATAEYIYSTDDERVVITEDGRIINRCFERKPINITVTSRSDPSISLTCPLYNFGVNPDDERIERFEVNVSIESESTESLPAEQTYTSRVHYLNCYAIFKPDHLNALGLTPETNRVRVHAHKQIRTERGNIVIQPETDLISFIDAGEDSLSIRFIHGSGEPFDRELTDLSFSAVDNDGWELTPSSPLVPFVADEIQAEKIGANEYKLAIPSSIYQFSIHAQSEWGVNTMYRLETEGDVSETVFQKNSYFQRLTNRGEFTVKMISLLDESIVTRIHVELQSIDPGEFSVYCPEKQSFFESKISYQYAFDLAPSFNTPIKIEIVEGNDVISIDEDGGNMRFKKFGSVKLRFTPVEFPEKAVERDIKIVFIDDISNFISKIMGHFTVFFLLGLGFSCFILLLSKHKRLSAIYASGSLLLYSALTELFQSPLFNNDRGASMIDVFFNFASALIGIATAYTLILSFLAIFKKKDAEGYACLADEAKLLSFKTVWKKR